MSRCGVFAIFAIFMATSIRQTLEHAGPALHSGPPRAWLVLGFWILKTGVVAAFCWFIVARPEARRRTREPVAFVACAAALGAAAALQGPEPSASTPLLVAGEAVALAGCAWMLVSVLALGRCFGVLPEARGLVTRGPYRLVRHPLYLGELAACAGLVMGAPTTWNAVVASVLVAGQIMRMQLEEEALSREFPQYAEYAARTRRILPWPVRTPSVEPAPGLGAR